MHVQNAVKLKRSKSRSWNIRFEGCYLDFLRLKVLKTNLYCERKLVCDEDFVVRISEFFSAIRNVANLMAYLHLEIDIIILESGGDLG